MSPAMNALSSVGITQSIAILAVLFVFAAIIIGTYWQIILPGAIAIFVISLFFTFTPDEVTTSGKSEVKEEVVLDDDYSAFMEDCLTLAQYSKKQCNKLWHQRGEAEVEQEENPVSQVKLFDVKNKEYKQRRDEVLRKPNAVVTQANYH